MLRLMKMDCAIQNGWEKTFERMHLFEFFPTYVDTSKKKNKKSFFHDIDEFNVHLEYIHNGTTFCCHPNYKSNGEWYDWVMVQFDIAGSKASRGKKKLGMWNGHYFPSKILCFFVLPDDETTYAIIQSTSSSNHENDSILFERWELEESLCYQKNGKKYIYPNLHIVDVDSFGDPILAVMDDSNIEHDHNNDMQW